MSSTYVSVLRINGVPILPPVMTKIRREEMQLLREMAIKVEQRLLERQQALNSQPAIDQVDEAKAQEPPPEDFDETFTSETLPTDIPVAQEPSPHLLPHNPPVEDPEKTPRNPEEDFSPPKLIRSNSYTLDQPSPLLLKFLDSVSPSVVSTVSQQSPKKSKKKSSSPKSPSPGNRKKTPRKLSDPRLYGISRAGATVAKSESLDDTKRRLKIHSKGEEVEKFFMKSKTVKEFENLTQQREAVITVEDLDVSITSSPDTEPRLVQPNPFPSDEEFAKNLKNKSDSNNDEEKENQQILVNQLNLLNIGGERTSTPVQSSSEGEELAKDGAETLDETSFYSTFRGESPVPGHNNNNNMSLVSETYSRQYLDSIRAFIGSPVSVSRRNEEHEEIAATIINSHVRGYLIRRLLRTEFVQNIIETIKNVLFVILDSNPRDIQLKRSYLVQLNASCENLHNVFFQFSTRERMQVIAKDREMLLARLSQRRTRQAKK